MYWYEIMFYEKTLVVQQHVFRRHFFTTPSSFQGLYCCYIMNVCILTADDAVSPTYCWFSGSAGGKGGDGTAHAG